jgi:hypothetical protein
MAFENQREASEGPEPEASEGPEPRTGEALEPEAGEEPEDRPGEPGAEGGSDSPAADTPPAVPSEDESELGDTDQHSDA